MVVTVLTRTWSDNNNDSDKHNEDVIELVPSPDPVREGGLVLLILL